MKIVIASDHAGFKLKATLVAFLRNELGHEVIDMGADTYDESDDYPNFVAPAARAVSIDPDNVKAIILGGSGQGEAICANRFKNVRAVVYYGGSPEMVTLSREHNDANVLSLGARFLDEESAKSAVKHWLDVPFSTDPKYTRRIEQVEKLSKSDSL